MVPKFQVLANKKKTLYEPALIVVQCWSPNFGDTRRANFIHIKIALHYVNFIKKIMFTLYFATVNLIMDKG